AHPRPLSRLRGEESTFAPLLTSVATRYHKLLLAPRQRLAIPLPTPGESRPAARSRFTPRARLAVHLPIPLEEPCDDDPSCAGRRAARGRLPADHESVPVRPRRAAPQESPAARRGRLLPG